MVIAQQGWQGAREDGQSPVFLVTQAVTATRITRLLVLSPSTIPRATVYAGWPSAAMQGEYHRSGSRVCVPHRAGRHRTARLGSARRKTWNPIRAPPLPWAPRLERPPRTFPRATSPARALSPLKRRRAPAHEAHQSPTQRHEELLFLLCSVRSGTRCRRTACGGTDDGEIQGAQSTRR